MKNSILILFAFLLFANTSLFSQTEIWKMEEYSLGQTISSFPPGFTNSSPTMSEVMILPDSSYRMYVNVQLFGGQKHCIAYASSNDAIDWTYEDTCFCGPTDSTARNFIVGGPSIVQLPSGDYRMYYRTTQKFTITPSYHIRSAISTDGGITFTQEGIRIDIKTYDSTSPFWIVGHGTVWKYADNTFGAIFAVNPDSTVITGPSSLMHFTSADGLTWGGYNYLYYGHHDPIVFKHNGSYKMYAMRLAEHMVTAESADGLTWPALTDSASFVDTVDAPMLIGGTKRIGDVGGLVMPNNDVYLYTNFGTTTGPSKDIVRYTLQNPSAIGENKFTNETLTLYPNPTKGMFNLISSSSLGDIKIRNSIGEIIYQNKTATATLQINLVGNPPGIYFIQSTVENKRATSKIIIY